MQKSKIEKFSIFNFFNVKLKFLTSQVKLIQFSVELSHVKLKIWVIWLELSWKCKQLNSILIWVQNVNLKLNSMINLVLKLAVSESFVSKSFISKFFILKFFILKFFISEFFISKSFVSKFFILKFFISEFFISKSFVSKFFILKMILYSINSQLFYKILSIHDEVLQCINDDFNNDLNLEFLSFKQKIHAKSWANNKDLTYFRVFIIIFVI